MIVVNPVNQNIVLKITTGEETVTFTFRQLNYKVRSFISSKTSNWKAGKVTVDAGLESFLVVQHGLKKVEGLSMIGEDGEPQPYNLKFQSEENKALTDDCVEELLATEMTDKLMYSAMNMILGIPKEIVHPLTGEPIEGVEIIPQVAGLKKSNLQHKDKSNI